MKILNLKYELIIIVFKKRFLKKIKTLNLLNFYFRLFQIYFDFN